MKSFEQQAETFFAERVHGPFGGDLRFPVMLADFSRQVVAQELRRLIGELEYKNFEPKDTIALLVKRLGELEK